MTSAAGEAQEGESKDLVQVVSIVLSFNNFTDTDECLRSLAKQDYARHSIILVDNGSSDASLAMLEQAWGGRVQLIRNRDNLGVASGYNTGLAAALEAGADYVVTCNNDIVVEPEFVSTLVAAHQRCTDAAIAVPVILYYDHPDLVWWAGVRQVPGLFLSRNIWRNQRFTKVRALLQRPADSDYAPTCASMISRRALDAVGLLDDRFFFGHDDVEWCLRARRHGLRCLVVPAALVRHKVSVTSGVRGSNVLGPSSAYTHALGSVLVGAKHFKGFRALPFLLGLLAIRMPYNLSVMALAGAWRSILPYVRGLVEGFFLYGPGFFRSSEP